MSKKIIVSKFGGTSMGDAQCMLRSAQVVCDQDSSIVVVSATSGTTNDLIALGKMAEKGSWENVEVILEKIKTRHRQICQELNSPEFSQKNIEILFQELESISKGIHLLRDCSLKAMDTLMSLGERLSSLLFTDALALVLKQQNKSEKAQWLDVRDVLKTDDQYSKAKPLISEIQKQSELILSKCRHEPIVFVTQGFIGQTVDGMTTTLGRGGSDYSAALLAEGVSADILEIWTDVEGIATTDPRICSDARSIEEISFKEASELATFGAKVLHPATLLPAMRKQIPTFVGSSFKHHGLGTWIKEEVEYYPMVRALALRKKQVLVTISTPEMLNAYGFLLQIFEVFDRYKISVDAITTSEISVAVTLDDSTLQNKNLIADLQKIADVRIEEGLTLVSLIGNNINHTPGLGLKIFEAIQNINVRMICLGASKHNFCFLVDEAMGEEAVKRLHQAFIE